MSAGAHWMEGVERQPDPWLSESRIRDRTWGILSSGGLHRSAGRTSDKRMIDGIPTKKPNLIPIFLRLELIFTIRVVAFKAVFRAVVLGKL